MKSLPFIAYIIAFIVAIPTGAYLVIQGHWFIGSLLCLCPFAISVSSNDDKD